MGALDQYGVAQLGVLGVLNNLVMQMHNLDAAARQAASSINSALSQNSQLQAERSKAEQKAELEAERDRLKAQIADAGSRGAPTTDLMQRLKAVQDALKHYKRGTRSSAGGLAVTDEDGYELKLTPSQGKFTMLPERSMVFSAEATRRLWEFANQPYNIADNILARVQTSSPSKIVSMIQNKNSQTSSPTVNVTIQGNADRETVRELKRWGKSFTSDIDRINEAFFRKGH